MTGVSAPSPAPLTAGARPRLLLALSLALVPAFAATTAITQGYKAEQRRLASEWFERGGTALDEGRPEEAIEAFRTALTFSREDRTFRLRLAQALAASGRTTEARAYLLSLRDAQPGNGPVNLELARLAARSGNQDDAYRYYHASLEGAWSNAAEGQRRAIRLELARYLMATGARLPAQSELIVLAADLPPDRDFQRQVAGLMLRAGLAARAQSLYEQILKADPDDPAALAGAGRAAFESGTYIAAETLLTRATESGADLQDVEPELSTLRRMSALDPYRRQLSLRARAERAAEALAIAETRLTRCRAAEADAGLAALAVDIPRHRTGLTRPGTRDLNAVDEAMDLVFRIEQAVATLCGEPEGADRALLLLAVQRAGGAN